jgi:RHS repeat-associated protein
VDGNAIGLFVDDEPIAAWGSNEGSFSITAAPSGSDNTGIPARGVTRTTAGEYSKALSFNSIGGELLAEYLPAAAPNAPQKEYGYRGEWSIVTVQSGGVVSVSPTANQSPDPAQGRVAVSSPSNTGHGSTGSSAFRAAKGSESQTKSCLWHSFSAVSGTRARVTLKFDWALNANINVSADDEFVNATAEYDFRIEYSLDNGSTWIVRRGVNDSVSITDGSGPGSDGDGINTSGSESIDLPNPGTIDITQIRVRDRIFTSASVRLSNNGSASSNATASVSNIRLEVEMVDSTAPVITGVSSSAVTNNSATISWNTNEPADSQVVYGPTQAYGQSTTLNPALVTAHSQELSGLTPGTLYYYRVKSRDAAGNLATSAEFTFTTVPLDTTEPIISNVAAGATTTTATITWTTNENSDSQVVYGPTQTYGQSTTLNPTLVTAHSQGLSGLTPGTLYYYRVKSRDAAGNLATSAEFTFTTAQNGSARIKWLVTDHLGSTRMVIDETGSLAGMKRHDFLPFGELLSAGVGIRSASIGYGGDSVRQKFTGKERDETGLDYFLARYYSSVQGRFTSVDPENAGADPELPQTWNGYSYSINNPVTYSDPDGLKVKICDTNGNCSEISDADARKYFYNKEYQNQSGYRVEREGMGNIYDTAGNKIGSYERTSADDLSGFANGVFFGKGGLIERAPQMQATIGLTIGVGVAGGITGGVTIYAFGGGAGVTTLGLSGGTGATATTEVSTVAASEEILKAVGGKITGYTKHALNQAISRDGVGVSPRAILDAVKKPLMTIPQKNGAIKYVGQNATVVLNQFGKVITTWARNSAGTRIQR